VGVVVVMDCQVCGVKEVLEEGRERREPQGVRNLRERYIMYV